MRGAWILGLLASCGDNAARPVDAGVGWDNELFLAPTGRLLGCGRGGWCGRVVLGDLNLDGKLDLVGIDMQFSGTPVIDGTGISVLLHR